jgi:short-subunit dehydrogenase
MHKAIYFVTGASGFVGRGLCRRLVESGAHVHAVVRRGDPELQELGVRLWIGDLWDDLLLEKSMQGAEYVIHCAGDAVFGNGPQYYQSNVALTEHLLRRAGKLETLRRFVYVSTIGAVDRARWDDCRRPLDEACAAYPSSDYGRTKLEAEKRVIASGLPCTILRPAMVVGEEMRQNSHFAVFARQAITNSPVARIAWPGAFSVVHVDDLASALQLAAVEPGAQGQTLYCAGTPISVARFYELCRPGMWRIHMGWLQGLARRIAPFLPFSVKALLLPALVADDARLRALGWSASKSVELALSPVIARERARVDPDLPPGGQTVVTGAASGLGRALVGRLAHQRARLLLVDRDAVGLAEVASSHPNCCTLVGDLSTEPGVRAVTDSIEWRQYPVTEFFSCAGLGRRGRMQEIPTGEHRRMFEVNVLARIEMTQRALAEMIPRQFGRIVLISSSSAFQPLPYMATYAATNSALLSIGESWNAEVSSQGVDVMTVCPGGMQTNFQENAGVRKIEGERLMSPGAVADAIINGLRARRMTLIVSSRSHSMSVLSRVLPRKLTVRLWGHLMERMR